MLVWTNIFYAYYDVFTDNRTALFLKLNNHFIRMFVKIWLVLVDDEG